MSELAHAPPPTSNYVVEPISTPSPPIENRSFFKDERLVNFLSGSAAGIAGKLIELPFDITKIRLQTQPVNQRIYSGPLDCIRQLIKKEGVFGFYKGGTSPILGAVMENAVLFVAYGQIQRLIRGPDESKQLSLSQLALAGGMAGTCVSFVLTPVEFIKIRLQVQTTAGYYRGPVDVVLKTLREDGARAFYRGHLATAARESFGGCAWFGVYELMCKLLSKDGSKDSLAAWQLMLAGSTAGVAFNFSLFPADVLKSQVQSDRSGINKSYMRLFRDLLQAEGIRGLYRGLGITLIRAVPANAAIFGTYELVSRTLKA